MIRNIAVLFACAGLVSCYFFPRQRSVARPKVMPEPLTDAQKALASEARPVLDHPIPGWSRNPVIEQQSGVAAVYDHSDGQSRIVIGTHRLEDVDPSTSCESLQTVMMLNGMPVSPLEESSDGSWCGYEFRGTASDGSDIAGAYYVKVWRRGISVVFLGRWPGRDEQDRLRDFYRFCSTVTIIPPPP